MVLPPEYCFPANNSTVKSCNYQYCLILSSDCPLKTNTEDCVKTINPTSSKKIF